MDIRKAAGIKKEEGTSPTQGTKPSPPSPLSLALAPTSPSYLIILAGVPKVEQHASGSDPLLLFTENHPDDDKMPPPCSSSSSTPAPPSEGCSFAQLAAHYRIFMLEDLLAEPQELAYDPYRQVIYVSQRCLQGHAASPVEYAAYVSVFDACPTSATQGTFVSTIDITPYGGPHGIEMDGSGAYLYIDVSTDSQGGKGTISIDLSTQTVVGYVAATGVQKPHVDESGEFVAEVCLRKGRIIRKLTVPESERNNNLDIGSGRHINFSTPGIRFGGRSTDKGLRVLDTSDPVAAILRRVLATGSIYVLSKNVLLV